MPINKILRVFVIEKKKMVIWIGRIDCTTIAKLREGLSEDRTKANIQINFEAKKNTFNSQPR